MNHTPTVLNGFADAGVRCALIGMVHLPPLPGSPGWNGSISTILDAAQRDAERLVENGCHGLIVENMGDLPYVKGPLAPETVAAMTRATSLVTAFGLPTGVQALAGANIDALGIAVASGAQFIRAEAFAYAHVADEGWIDASAGPVLRRRAQIGLPIDIWADVQKKHSSHAITQDLSLEEICHGTLFCGADAVIITGDRTGEQPDETHLERARSTGAQVVVGSGVDVDNISVLGARCDALIVGSALKYEGRWQEPVDGERVRRLRFALDESVA